MIFLAFITGALTLLIGILIGHAISAHTTKTSVTIKKEPV